MISFNCWITFPLILIRVLTTRKKVVFKILKRILMSCLFGIPMTQLMTVMERCEKIPVETFETSLAEDSCPGGQYQLPRLDRDGKLLGDSEYSAPSPPERDKPHSPLTQAELDQYTRNYQLEVS